MESRRQKGTRKKAVLMLCVPVSVCLSVRACVCVCVCVCVRVCVGLRAWMYGSVLISDGRYNTAVAFAWKQRGASIQQHPVVIFSVGIVFMMHCLSRYLLFKIFLPTHTPSSDYSHRVSVPCAEALQNLKHLGDYSTISLEYKGFFLPL